MQLHVVQEMFEFCDSEMADSESENDLMVLSAHTQNSGSTATAIKLSCQIGEHKVLFLLDSSSSHSFLSEKLAQMVDGHKLLPQQQRVRIAGGGHLTCTSFIPKCTWTAGGFQFQSDFKILPLKYYDGIIGMDWLSARGTMQVNWQQKWLAFDYKNQAVYLQGEPQWNYS